MQIFEKQTNSYRCCVNIYDSNTLSKTKICERICKTIHLAYLRFYLSMYDVLSVVLVTLVTIAKIRMKIKFMISMNFVVDSFCVSLFFKYAQYWVGMSQSKF